MSSASPQIEADKKLIKFQTYEDYLNSLVTANDHCYLQSTSVSRTIAELGYRSSGETLTRDEFEQRLSAVKEYLYPTFKPNVLASEGISSSDSLSRELAIRERSNRLGMLAQKGSHWNAKLLTTGLTITSIIPEKLLKKNNERFYAPVS